MVNFQLPTQPYMTEHGILQRLNSASATSCNILWHLMFISYLIIACYVASIGDKEKKTPWSESASELYRPNDRRLSAKWLPTFADRGCHVVSVMDPYGRILGFLHRSRYFSISSSSVVLTRLSGPRSRPTTFFLLVVPGIEPGPPNLQPRTLITRPQRQSLLTQSLSKQGITSDAPIQFSSLHNHVVIF
jgi:hypothetical protein